MTDSSTPRRIPIQDAGDPQEGPDEVSGPVPSAEALVAESPELERIAQLEADLAAERENSLRALADLQNYRRRVLEEKQQQLQFANQGLIEELLPVLDNFERATECQVTDDAGQSLYKGVCMILGQLQDVLSRFGVERLKTEGEFFDPARHEAVERVETTELCEGTIVGEVLPGYTLNGRVIRAARVRVAVEPHSG